MARPPRADEAGGLYHALNRGNIRNTIFHKDGDYEAFERIVSEALDRYQDEHFLTVSRYVERNALWANLVERAEAWRWGSLWRWL